MTPTHSRSASTFAEALLSPRAVALVGASGDSRKNTARPLRFMRKHGYAGAIYPINAARAEILGERAYPSLGALPGPVDHVFIMIPGDGVAALLPDCARAGARVVTIYSDGFGEAGADGQARQAELVRQARALGLRLLGPNSIGLADLHSGGILSVNAAFEADTLLSGGISLVSQSGSMMGSLLSRAAARGFGFAKSVSVGNESDITVGEVVDALVDDRQTQVILLFLETLRAAPTMASALARAKAAGKPVVAYKLGRSEQGDALAQSHTGAMAGNDVAVDAFLKAHGVLRVHQLETLFEIAPLVARHARPAVVTSPGEAVARVAVITTTGGGAATVVDNLGLRGLAAVAPPAQFVREIAEGGLTIRETPVIDLTLAATSDQYKMLLEALLRADWCDAVLSVVGSSAQFHPGLAVQPLLQADKPPGKPLAVFLAPEAPASLALLQEGGIAAFRSPEACADALAVFFAPPGCPPASGEALPWPEGLPRSGMLNEYEAGTLFRAVGVPVVQASLLTPEKIEHGVPYPVVAKVCSRDLAHKTELGAVRVGIRDGESLESAVRQMLEAVERHAPHADVDGILVQPMEDRLIELILGYRHDPLVGPTVLLGAGGITAELTPDYSLRLAPVDVDEARRMILEVRQTRLISGFRGLPEGDCEALARAIAAFSRLALCAGVRIDEAEINPLFVRADGVIAVDGLVRLG
ncbi:MULTISPECIES: acetate--CoA ligase family protein [Achromobacter]|uniref:acetate--CoA ligase family protein n=1 Tax=Achromobacter TaxID=222 RepID=UPI00244A65EE|nr:acetate--CoA ligase family protein [Achromobacter mucicolens]MDH1520786.1 acetate--CoA ligase family protein [Achromobacter mucicolens]